VQDNYRLASGYYSVLAMIKLAEIYDVNLDPEQAYATIKKVQPYVNGQINIPTPINFTYNNSNYQIKSDNLQALKNDYYRILQEMCFYRSKYDELKQVVNAQINMNSDYASTAKGIGFLLNLAFEKSIDLTTMRKFSSIQII
jgi:hypothetical protein